jgi:hypothetical protein
MDARRQVPANSRREGPQGELARRGVDVHDLASVMAAGIRPSMPEGGTMPEQKAKNLEHNRHCILTTGRNSLAEGLDLVLEGDAVRMTDEAKL